MDWKFIIINLLWKCLSYVTINTVCSLLLWTFMLWLQMYRKMFNIFYCSNCQALIGLCRWCTFLVTFSKKGSTARSAEKELLLSKKEKDSWVFRSQKTINQFLWFGMLYFMNSMSSLHKKYLFCSKTFSMH